ncbi:hypothetical protein, partial [Vibrio nigripulchritudo]|uniref:hypothetical protein n=1 Tax=Vibrio nigripulchritudo TaxID=28173 RepID=UPI001E29E454
RHYRDTNHIGKPFLEKNRKKCLFLQIFSKRLIYPYFAPDLTHVIHKVIHFGTKNVQLYLG